MPYRFLLFLTAILLAFNATAQLATQKSSANGVTVAVTPGNFAADAKTWEFSIVLDTHTQDLADDLFKSAVLVDDRGNEFKALGWDGAAPGGHHRTGVLKFKAIEPKPQALELRISRQGEAKARTFRWRLK
jgi:hypothetical protein